MASRSEKYLKRDARKAEAVATSHDVKDHLSELPAELLDTIYHLAIDTSVPLEIRKFGDTVRGKMPGLIQTCKKLYLGASHLHFDRDIIFKLDVKTLAAVIEVLSTRMRQPGPLRVTKKVRIEVHGALWTHVPDFLSVAELIRTTRTTLQVTGPITRGTPLQVPTLQDQLQQIIILIPKNCTNITHIVTRLVNLGHQASLFGWTQQKLEEEFKGTMESENTNGYVSYSMTRSKQRLHRKANPNMTREEAYANGFQMFRRTAAQRRAAEEVASDAAQS